MEHLVGRTLSCSHVQHEKIAKQCGVCVACVFRRQSLHAAGLLDPSSQYKDLIFDKGMKNVQIPEEGKKALKHFLGMVDRIASKDALQQHFLSTHITPSQKLYSLFHRYRQEWLDFCDSCVQEKWAWSHYVMPTR